MPKNNFYINYARILRHLPDAAAVVRGSFRYPEIEGIVKFYQTNGAVLVASEITGLPEARGICESRIFAIHIHEGNSCTGNQDDPFADARTHYNPYSCPHPYHAGDMPPLFGANGIAYSVFLSDRFMLEEIIGKTVIIHSSFDDFTTQPAGNAGEKIACGEIVKVRR